MFAVVARLLTSNGSDLCRPPHNRAKVGTPQFPYGAHRYPRATRYGSRGMLVARERGPDSRAPKRLGSPGHTIPIEAPAQHSETFDRLPPLGLGSADQAVGCPLVAKAFVDGCCHERVPKEG